MVTSIGYFEYTQNYAKKPVLALKSALGGKD